MDNYNEAYGPLHGEEWYIGKCSKCIHQEVCKESAFSESCTFIDKDQVIILPCAPGTKYYWADKATGIITIDTYKNTNEILSDYLRKSFGKHIFFTLEDAEESLSSKEGVIYHDKTSNKV